MSRRRRGEPAASRLSLRARITLVVIASFALLTLGVTLEGLLRQRISAARYDEAIVAADRNGWDGLATIVGRQLRDEVAPVVGDAALVGALARGDREALAAAAAPVVRHLREAGREALLRPDLEIAAADGRVLFTTRPDREASLPVAGALEAVRRGARGLLGLTRALGSDEYLVAAAAPVYARDGLAGLATLSVPAATVLPALEEALGASAAIVGPEGALTRPAPAAGKGGDAILPPEAAAGLDPGPAGRADRIGDAQGRSYYRAAVALDDLLGRPAGTLVSLRDITATRRRIALIDGLSYAGLAGFALLLAGFLQFQLRHALRPLSGVVRVLDALARGRRDVAFEAPPRRRRDEIGDLARAVEAFRVNLAALEEARAAQTRMEGELAIARRIQLEMVPSLFPTVAERADFSLHAILEPAKAVGGDLYDFFLIDERRLFFVVGDVSDKGVPAALFMAQVRTLFRVMAHTAGLPLADIVGRVNAFLAEDNPSAMFVTAFAAILDTGTGEVEYCDGGHEPPFIRRGDGSVEHLVKVGGLALGLLPDFAYRTARLRLGVGDTLLLYTDGVNEAMNAEKGMFGTAGIGALMARLPADAPPEALTTALLDAVQAFAAGAPQSDDITVLAVRLAGDGGAGGLSVAARHKAAGEGGA